MKNKTMIILFTILLSAAFALPAGASATDTMDMSDHGGMNMDDPHAMEAAGTHAMTGSVNWYAIISLLGIIGVAGFFASKTEKLKKVNFLNYAP